MRSMPHRSIAGFGLFLVPMDLINDFRNRPIRMSVGQLFLHNIFTTMFL